MVAGLRLFFKIISTALVIVVVLLAVLLVGVRLVGFTPYTVLSGSMEPTYHVGSIIYVSKIQPTDLKLMDPVTYRSENGIVVTHRIIEILNPNDPEKLAFRLKGDANEIPDGAPIPASALLGKPLFSIPYLGYLSVFMKKPAGLSVIVGICALAVLSSVLAEKPSQAQEEAGEASEEAEQETEEP